MLSWADGTLWGYSSKPALVNQKPDVKVTCPGCFSVALHITYCRRLGIDSPGKESVSFLWLSREFV